MQHTEKLLELASYSLSYAMSDVKTKKEKKTNDVPVSTYNFSKEEKERTAKALARVLFDIVLSGDYERPKNT